METSDSMRLLDDRAIRGEALSEAERAELEVWYETQDDLEKSLLNKNSAEDVLEQRRQQIQNARDEISDFKDQIQTLADRNKALWRKNERLHQKTASDEAQRAA